MFFNIDNYNEMERDDELYFKESDDELDYKVPIKDYKYLLYGNMNELNNDIFFSRVIQENVENNKEGANSIADAPENNKEIPKDNNMDKEMKKDKTTETITIITKKHNVNNSDEISVQKNQIAEIAAPMLKKNKEANTTIIKDKKYDKKDINEILVNEKGKTINEEEKISHVKKEENELISNNKENINVKIEKDNNKNINLLGKKRTLNACGYNNGIPVIIDLSPDAEWYKILKRKKGQK